jgi:hypothetical protein
MMKNLNPALLQLTDVRRHVCQIVRKESDAMTEPVKNFDDLEHPQRSGVAVGHRQMMVDNQNVLARRSSGPMQKRDIPVGWSRRQFITPHLCES